MSMMPTVDVYHYDCAKSPTTQWYDFPLKYANLVLYGYINLAFYAVCKVTS